VACFVGIDVGVTGALAVLSDTPMRIIVSTSLGMQDVDVCPYAVFDTPVARVQGAKKARTEYQPQGMAALLRNFVGARCTAALELAGPMPGEGVVGVFGFGRGHGLWEGILAALRIPYQLIRPQQWKKAMLAGLPKGKDASRIAAQRLFPNADLSLKRYHGRADSLLLAEFLRRSTPHAYRIDAIPPGTGAIASESQ